VVGSPIEVMREVRDRVHRGYRLMGHPLAGSIRLLRNPYRTVVLGQPEVDVNTRDLLQVEETLWRLSEIDFDTAPESALPDYQSMDLELLEAFFREQT